jgi:hypothetical protein
LADARPDHRLSAATKAPALTLGPVVLAVGIRLYRPSTSTSDYRPRALACTACTARLSEVCVLDTAEFRLDAALAFTFATARSNAAFRLSGDLLTTGPLFGGGRFGTFGGAGVFGSGGRLSGDLLTMIGPPVGAGRFGGGAGGFGSGERFGVLPGIVGV